MNARRRDERVRYEVNVCGGDFDSVRQRFDTWKHESLIYRPERKMFDGKDEVRRVDELEFDDTEAARHALQRVCTPNDRFALAVPVHESGRDIWLVMAAYDE